MGITNVMPIVEENARLRAELTDKIRLVETLRADHQRLLGQLIAAGRRIGKSESNDTYIRGVVQTVECSAFETELSKRLKIAKDERDGYRGQTGELAQQLKAEQNLVAEYRRQRDLADSRLSTTRDQLADAKDQIKKLNRELIECTPKELADRIASLEQELKSDAEERVWFESRIRELNNKVEHLTSALKATESARQWEHSSWVERQAWLAERKAEFAEASDKGSAIGAAIGRSKGQISWGDIEIVFGTDAIKT